MIFQMPAKKPLQAKHRGFSEAARVIATELFPACASVLLNGVLELPCVDAVDLRPVAATPPPRREAESRRPPGAPATLDGRLAYRQPHRRPRWRWILGRPLRQQIRQDLGIPYEGRSRFSGDDRVGVRIHGQMQLAPNSTPTRAVLAHRPFAFAVDLASRWRRSPRAGVANTRGV